MVKFWEKKPRHCQSAVFSGPFGKKLFSGVLGSCNAYKSVSGDLIRSHESAWLLLIPRALPVLRTSTFFVHPLLVFLFLPLLPIIPFTCLYNFLTFPLVLPLSPLAPLASFSHPPKLQFWPGLYCSLFFLSNILLYLHFLCPGQSPGRRISLSNRI